MTAPLIILVGMPGSGKTTVGRHLARQFGFRFVDADHVLEPRLGSSIRAYFEVHGEAAFRAQEAALLAELCAPAGREAATVLATGGGAVLREDNRRLLKAAGKVVYLRAAPDDIARRLRQDAQRPLLQVADPAQRLRDMFRQRDPLYREVAHFVIDASRPSSHALLSMVRTQLELAGVVSPTMPPPPPAAAAPHGPT